MFAPVGTVGTAALGWVRFVLHRRVHDVGASGDGDFNSASARVAEETPALSFRSLPNGRSRAPRAFGPKRCSMSKNSSETGRKQGNCENGTEALSPRETRFADALAACSEGRC
jgi:hypothetical protein